MKQMHAMLVDTTGNRLSITVCDGEAVVASQTIEAGTKTSEMLLPALEFLLTSASVPTTVLDRLHVVVGPGSFTGIRVGISTLQGIAAGLDIPLTGIASLDAAALVSGRERLTVASRLRGKEYAARRYDFSRNEWSDYEIVLRDALGDDPLIINSKGDVNNVSLDLSSALGHPLFPEFLREAEPLYLRKSEAELNFDPKSA